MEILVTKADPSAALMLKEEPVCILNDMTSLLSGFTISYLEFSQGMCQNKTLLRDIYEPVFASHAIQKYEQLKEIASEQAPPALLAATQIKKGKKKKKWSPALGQSKPLDQSCSKLICIDRGYV